MHSLELELMLCHIAATQTQIPEECYHFMKKGGNYLFHKNSFIPLFLLEVILTSILHA